MSVCGQISCRFNLTGSASALFVSGCCLQWFSCRVHCKVHCCATLMKEFRAQMLPSLPASFCASHCAHQVSLSFCCWDVPFRGHLASCAQSEALGICRNRFGPCRDRISEATEKDIGRGQRGAGRLVVHAFMPLSHFTDSDSEGSRLRNTGKRFNEMNSPNYAHLATRAEDRPSCCLSLPRPDGTKCGRLGT